MELLSQPAFLALIGTIFGGVGLKIVENFLNKSKTKEDVAAAIRRELREDVTALRTEIKTLEKEVDTWRDRYYTLKEEVFDLKNRLNDYEIKEEHAKTAGRE